MLYNSLQEIFWSSSASDTAFSLPRTWVQSLVREIRSHMLHSGTANLFNYLYSDVFWKELFEYDNKLFCPKFCPLQDFHWTFTLLNYSLYFPINLSIYHWYTFTFNIRRRSVHLFICWCFHKYLHKKCLESESRWWVFHDLLSFLWVQAKDKGNGSISMS